MPPIINAAAIALSMLLALWQGCELSTARRNLHRMQAERDRFYQDSIAERMERNDFNEQLHLYRHCYKKQYRITSRLYQGFKELLARHGLAAVVIAETGEVIEVEAAGTDQPVAGHPDALPPAPAPLETE